jgi:hypothetical protein
MTELEALRRITELIRISPVTRMPNYEIRISFKASCEISKLLAKIDEVRGD